MKPKWLDRRIAAPGPYLTLCLSQDEFDAVLKHLDIPHTQYLRTARADATTHHLHAPGKKLCSVVCLGDMSGRTGVEIAGLLVHEAVHVWQEYADCIGENQPGCEQEAYAVQAIAQELMAEYSRRLSDA